MNEIALLEWARGTGFQIATVILIAGVIICDLWRRLINRYSELLKWWFKQLRALEEKLPDSSKLLTEEYKDLYKYDHIGIAKYETRLITIFQIMYVAAGLGMIGVWFAL